MRVGITASREGMTTLQRDAFRRDILALEAFSSPGCEFHHGGCVGGDTEASHILKAEEALLPVQVVCHPSNILSMTGKFFAHKIFPAKKPLDRNKDIVDSVTMLYVCPKSDHEELRSGTWATCRYARKRGVEVRIIWPDGSVSIENQGVSNELSATPSDEGAVPRSGISA